MKKFSKSIFVICLALFMCVGLFTSCNGGSIGGYSTEELEEMSQKAEAYESSANFDKAFELYEILYENEFPDKDFSSKGLEEAFKTRKGRYTRNAIVCQMYEYAVNSLKNILKDPRSLVVHQILMDDVSSTKINITIDYSAANSFGGMIRDEYTCSYTLSASQCEDIYESLKDFMDGRGDTSAKSTAYLVGNYNIYKQSQYDAIVAGTCSY